MKRKLQLSLLAVSTASLLGLSSVALAAGNHYKGENYKGEMMAAPCPSCLMLKDGWYVGAQVGYDAFRTRVSTTVNDADGDVISLNPRIASTGWAGGLLAGYGQNFNPFYLGGEIFINDSSAEGRYSATAQTASLAGIINDTVSYTAKFTVSPSYGIGILPGMKLNDSTLGYVRLGWNRARLKGSEILNSSSSVTSSASNRQWRNGFNYGLGVETAIADNLSIRGEYTTTNYKSFNTTFGTKFNPTNSQFMLGLLYHFA